MKKALTITVIFLLIAVLSFGLSACQKDTISDTSELRVTFDESTTYSLEELTDGSDTFSVEVVSGEDSKKVAFHIESKTVTEDGKYIEVVISAEGFTKTIRLPYAGEQNTEIRAELRPLYNMLSAEGGKSFAFTVDVASVEKTGAEEETFAWKALLNLLSDDVQFALLRGAKAENGTTEYGEPLVSFGGITPNLAKYQETLELLLGSFDLDFDLDALLEGEEDGAASDETQDEPAVEEEDDSALHAFFVDLSTLIGTIEGLSENPAVALSGVEISETEGIYHVKGNSKKLFTFLKAFLDEDILGEIDLDEIADLLDVETDGAFKQGKIMIDLSFGIKDTTASVSFGFENALTGAKTCVTLSMEMSATPFVIPVSEEEDALGSDLEIKIPLSLPQRELSLTLTAVVHFSNILSEGSGDLLTATLDINDIDDAAVFELHDAYAYLDITAFATANEWGDDLPKTFAYTFEKDGKPASLWEVLPDLLTKDPAEETEPYQEEDEDEEDDDEEEEEDPLFANGYGVTILDDGELKFTIGVTEQELRDKLEVYTFDEEDEQIPFDDYTIEGFDGSASFSGDITIVLDDDHIWELPVVIYDPENARKSNIVVSGNNLYAKGITVGEAQETFRYLMRWTDGTATWDEECEGLIFKQIFSPTFALLSTDNVMNEVGNYMVLAEKDGLEVGVTIYIYDPENLILQKLDCSTEVWVGEGETVDDIRSRIFVQAFFDDGSVEDVIDYEIEGFEDGATSITVTYGGKIKEVVLKRSGSFDPEEEEKQGSILDYLRFADGLEEGEDLVAAVLKILQENKEAADAVLSVIKGDTSATLHVNINTRDNKDLFAFLNLFFGIPSESGWIDLDENNLPDVIEDLTGGEGSFDLNGMLSLVAGDSLSEMLSDLMLDVTFSWNDGIGISLSLAGSREKVYLSVGVSVKTVAASAPITHTEEELAGASDFEALSSVIFLVLSQLVA